MRCRIVEEHGQVVHEGGHDHTQHGQPGAQSAAKALDAIFVTVTQPEFYLYNDDVSISHLMSSPGLTCGF